MRRIEIIKDGELCHYVYPTRWTEVTVAQYAGLFELPQDSTPFESAIWLLTYFTHITQEDLFGMRMSELNSIAAELEFLHTTTPESNATTLEAGGWSWRRRRDWNDITYGEKVSLETLQRDARNPVAALPKLMCILLERFDPETDKAIPFSSEQLNAETDFASLPITSIAGVLESFTLGTSLS